MIGGWPGLACVGLAVIKQAIQALDFWRNEMGFKPEPTVYKLAFAEDTPLHGLNVRIRGCSVGEWNNMVRMTAEKDASLIADNNIKVAQMFLDHLVDWDLEDDEGPVPHTQEGIDRQDSRIMNDIIAAWQVAMTGIPDSLGKASENGSSSLERSLDLGKSSQNQ